MFKKNEGTIDRVLRVLIGIALFYIAYSQTSGAAQIFLYILALASLLTGALGYCHLYSLLKISTMKKNDKKLEDSEKTAVKEGTQNTEEEK